MFYRFRVYLLCTCLGVVFATHSFAEPVLRKLTLVDTGNYLLNHQSANLLLPESLTVQEMLALRDFAHDLVAKSDSDEWKQIVRTVAWVHTHVQHDSFNQTSQTSSLQILQRAGKGERFSCVEYAKVLRDLLHMQGIVARSIGLQAATIAYGTLGSSHVAVEAWSNTYNKWVLLDAQWGVYAAQNKKPLNVGELYQLRRKGRLDQVRFPLVAGQTSKEQENEYRQFLASYFGYLSFRIHSDATVLNLIYPLAGTDLPLTFQGLPKNNQLFSRNAQDIYFALNQAHAILRFRNRDKSYQQFSQIEFRDADDYLQQMAKFAPDGELEVVLDHNMPWFDHFEVRLEQADWQVLPANMLDWALQPGQNRMQIRAVNAAGIKGPVTELKLLYE